MEIIISPELRWKRIEAEGVEIHYVGREASVRAIAAAAFEGMDAARKALNDAPGHFACIIKGPDFVLASVDNCRTTPVFYTDGFISNSAEAARAHSRIEDFNDDAVTEVAMAGWVTGSETIYEGLHQLQAGEFIYQKLGDEAPKTGWFYQFIPDVLDSSDIDTLSSITGNAFDSVMRRLVDEADGRPIWVPLSGGLDSRLILCKLVELGYPNVQAFSYGPKGNDEAEAAKEVAAALGVKWHFFPSTKADMRRFFASPRRKAFWDFANGHNSVPNFQDLLPLCQLMDRGLVNKGDIIVNGQSGDFITGNHIPPSLLKDGVGLDDMFAAIAKKHFSLWESLKTPKNIAMVRNRIFSGLGLKGDEKLSPQEIAAAYEYSEYIERQSKFVVSGQQVYDFLELDWFLPLWDPEFVKPWRNIPAKVKVGQAVYLRYLETYNFKGLFENFKPCLDGWPGMSKLVLPFARIIRLTLGADMRDRYLKAMAVFGMYGYFFAPYPMLKTILESQNLRNSISLFVRTWLGENNVPRPTGL